MNISSEHNREPSAFTRCALRSVWVEACPHCCDQAQDHQHGCYQFDMSRDPTCWERSKPGWSRQWTLRQKLCRRVEKSLVTFVKKESSRCLLDSSATSVPFEELYTSWYVASGTVRHYLACFFVDNKYDSKKKDPNSRLFTQADRTR